MAEPDISFLYGQSVPRCTHRIDKHFDDYETLQYMSGGAVELKIGEIRHELRGRWFWSCYPGPRIAFHALEKRGIWAHRYLAFRGPLVGRWTTDRLFPIAPQRPPEGRDFAKRFDDLLASATRTDRWGRLRAVNLLEGILIELADARAQVSPGQPWLDQTIDTLNAAAEGGDVDYDSLCQQLGIDPTTLRRRFRAATGISPHAYLLECRAAAARKRLAETDEPIKTIAEQLGYKDVFFFSRQFRKLTGVPPAVYRRSRQG